jgi:hypothetical protein
LSAEGWTHLAFPNPARWWLDYYPSMSQHLEPVIDDPDTGVVFRLAAS